jgi:hypothetical protein
MVREEIKVAMRLSDRQEVIEWLEIQYDLRRHIPFLVIELRRSSVVIVHARIVLYYPEEHESF